MPVTMDTDRVVPCWSGRNPSAHNAAAHTVESNSRVNGHSANEPLHIALINNMPDSALEDTEFQFCELLESAAGDTQVRLHLFSLPDLARSDRGKQHIANFYTSTNDLRGARLDGAIITGTEPIQPDLRDEPYWKTLTGVMDWAADNTTSTVLSCLAAHAGALHNDGIRRNRLSDKQFGVFSHRQATPHELTHGLSAKVKTPHSRWNELRESDLTAGGYTVLTEAPDAGVDLFVKKFGRSLFVHFQGHPEYKSLTLLKEFRRDVRRFLNKERETYPTQPAGYFDAASAPALEAFHAKAIRERDGELMSEFPEAAISASLEHSWKSSASGIYRNWLNYLAAARKNQREARASGSAVHTVRD
jgi:homoserine O-succinyltransferase/O-acetyltransferase